MGEPILWHILAIVFSFLSALELGSHIVERYVFKTSTIGDDETFESEEEKQAVIEADNKGELITIIAFILICGLVAVYAAIDPSTGVWKRFVGVGGY